MVKNLTRVLLVALAIGWLCDFLFWKKQVGISFPIFTTVCLLAGLYLAWAEPRHLVWQSLSLFVPILFFTWMTVVRLEPLTVLINAGFTLFLMALLAASFSDGRWASYNFWDYVTHLFHLVITSLGLPVILYTQSHKEATAEPHRSNWKHIFPVLRGLLLALPVLVIFAALLSSADPIFKMGLEHLLAIFNLERFADLIYQGVFILMVAYAVAGVFLYNLSYRPKAAPAQSDRTGAFNLLGFTESAIILGSVDLLFAVFVGVQIRYFFGGSANIHLEGYTYSEYARRGFGELVAVAFFSLLLLVGLSTIARRESTRQRWVFSGTGLGQVILVCVILISAFQRLILYEQAYGFTRLRTYTHVFMAWLAVLLIGVAILEISARLRHFALIALLSALGFGITLNLLNVDQFIVNRNIDRARSGEELDPAYLATLSPDSIPAVVSAYRNPALSGEIHADLGGVLACQAAVIFPSKEFSAWQSYHFALSGARHQLQDLQDELENYPISLDTNGIRQVKILGQTRKCYSVNRD